MKQFNRELEYGFSVSAARAINTMIREKLIVTHQDIIHQTWLEEGEVGDYKFRTRIRRTEVTRPGMSSWTGKCEFTTKYSKSDETAVEQDNMELNAEILPEEYEKLKKIYKAVDKEEVTKIRTYFREPLDAFTIYTLDTYPNEKSDKARIEIEFGTPEEMKRWKAPGWLKELIGKEGGGEKV